MVGSVTAGLCGNKNKENKKIINGAATVLESIKRKGADKRCGIVCRMLAIE